MFCSILFYSTPFYSTLFYYILLYSIPFYTTLFHSTLFYSIPFYSTTLLYSIPFYSTLLCSILFYSTRAIWKTTSGEVKKTSNELLLLLLFLYSKDVLQLLLNVVTAEIEALVSGNKFLCTWVKEGCRLWAQPHFDTFHQLLIIA
jgi:hypothetical protein